MPEPDSNASIIVPTYRESANLPALVERIFAATKKAGITAELIIVDDDSQDGTDEVVATLARDYPVRLIVRTRERGLSSAVLAGFAQARYDRFVVLDADLQHPPEMVPALLVRLGQGDCDFAIGTRYVAGGEIAGDWPIHRKIVSLLAKLPARLLAPLSDPLSGFFALPREVWERAEQLDAIGYKIALELYVKGRCRKPAEVPIRFEKRLAGESKLSGAEMARYLKHLVKLYRFRYPWLGRTAGFVFLVLAVAVVALVYLAITGQS